MAEAGARAAASDRNKRRLIEVMASLRRSDQQIYGGAQMPARLPTALAPVKLARPSQPRISRLHRIVAAVELAQVSQPAHGEPVRILLARFHQRGEIFGHLGARLVARRGGAVHK